MRVRLGLVSVGTAMLVACSTPGTPAPKPALEGAVFTATTRVHQRVCGADVCVRERITNIGDAPGTGECRLFKLENPKSHDEVFVATVAIPTTSPGSIMTLVGRWEGDIEGDDVFEFRCEPGPRLDM